MDQILNLGIDRPVVDETGLAGKYDFRLVVIPEFKSLSQSQPGDIDIFSAVRALGLKLDAQKTQIEMVAVDRVHKPMAN